jgi:pimeloyl-ACP methyl ester carboxylesterase
MAARYVFEAPATIEGLILLAAYPAASNDLSGLDLDVTSIYGTQDGLASLDEILGSRSLLPDNTTWVEIQGGNHAQFGHYGPQAGDLEATIDLATQQDQVIQATLKQMQCGEE